MDDQAQTMNWRSKKSAEEEYTMNWRPRKSAKEEYGEIKK